MTMSLAPARKGTAAIIALFLIFYLSRIIAFGFPELEFSASEQIENNSLSIGEWPQMIEERGLLPELQQSRVLVPPKKFSWMTSILGVGTTTTWKRFRQPSDQWFSEIWQFCDPGFRVSGAEQVRAFVFDNVPVLDLAQSCYESLSWKQLEEIARGRDAQFAIVPLPTGSSVERAMLGDSKWGLIRVIDSKTSRNQ